MVHLVTIQSIVAAAGVAELFVSSVCKLYGFQLLFILIESHRLLVVVGVL